MRKDETINPCPICGKNPKIHYSYGFGGCVRIRCKPLFRKPHLTVQHCCADIDRAYNIATKEWNKACKNKTNVEDCYGNY